MSLLLELSWICWTLNNFILGCAGSFTRLIMPWEAGRAGAWDEHNKPSSNPGALNQSWDPCVLQLEGNFPPGACLVFETSPGPPQWSEAVMHSSMSQSISPCVLTLPLIVSLNVLCFPCQGIWANPPLHLVHAWQQTLLEEISQGTMLGQSLDPSVPIPPSPWRKEAPTTKASCGFKETLIFVISVKAFTEQLQNSGAIQDGSYQGLFVASALLSSLTHLFSNSCNGYWCLDSPALEKAQAGHGVTSFRAGRSWSSSSISTWQH